jgi:hypothetical protein
VTNGTGTETHQNVSNIVVHCAPWTKLLGSDGYDVARAVAVDSNGNIYVAGGAQGQLPNAATAQGNDDFALVKFAANGNRLWTRQWGSPGSDRKGGSDGLTTVAIDETEDAVYVAGFIDGDWGLPASQDKQQAYVAKLRANDGSPVWTRRWDGTGTMTINHIAVIGSRIYAVGQSWGDLTPCVAWDKRDQCTRTDTTIANSGASDIMLAVFDRNGGTLTMKLFGGTGNDSGQAVGALPDGNVVIAGGWAGAAGDDDGLLLAVDASGSLVTKPLIRGGAGKDYFRSIAQSGSRIYVTGEVSNGYPDATVFGGVDILVAMFDWDASLQSFVTGPVGALGTILSDIGYGIVVTPKDGVIVVGETQGDIAVPADANGRPSNLLLLCLDATLKTTCEAQQRSSATARFLGAAQDRDGNIVAVGLHTDPIDGYLTHAGGADILVRKYDTQGVVQ